jgi:2-dehydro-3-deoxyphosphogluconate aldolase/(4S)-4-hydroxy-2-oxoglutarate aldolase
MTGVASPELNEHNFRQEVLMDSQTAYGFIEEGHLMSAIRGQFTVDVALATTAILMEQGIKVYEMTMNSVDPINVMQAVKREYGDEACVGMGTVLNLDDAKRVLDAGADFIVSPAFQPEIVQAVLAAGVLVAPGVITPSECVAAWDMGVKLLKLFPIGALGIEYFKAMFGPLNHMNFMCNGAMHADNARQFLQAGAVACGMAGWLTGDGTMPQETIRRRARLLRVAVEAAQIPSVAKTQLV